MKIERIRLGGPLGNALQLSVNARLKTVDYRQLVDIFRYRNETDNAWRCEFWGKIVRSAILSNYYVQDPELAAIIRGTVRDILSTQTPDGCISSYPVEKQLDGWDIWGRKYVLLGLVRYYELVEPDPAVKEACIRLLDHLIAQMGGDGRRMKNFGWHDGLAACSICDAVVGVYRISGEKRFLDFAKGIIDGGASLKHNVFDAAAAGTAPENIGNGKAYELSSCFQGLAELCILGEFPDRRYVCRKYYEAIRDQEIFVTGVGGGKDEHGEYWCGGALEQLAPRPDSALGETCVTTTWLHYCDCILRLTGDPDVAGEAENALYNGILGAMTQGGSNWLHRNPTPLTGGGVKISADDQIGRGFGTPFGGNDCCRAQGPEALAFAPVFALQAKSDGVALNFYEAMDAEFTGGSLRVSGEYPYGNKAEVRMETADECALYLRVPAYLKKVTLNGENVEVPGCGVLALRRKWSKEDKLELEFDFTPYTVPAPGGQPYFAVKRGPIVLAEDERGVIPAAVHETFAGYTLCDYAAAGMPADEGHPFRVWFPVKG
ncbi:MAG: glycoside hydrolase family 127 protein [Lentisphaeria bacterium]|nr:glycoside hydrolase family 127 protein [Lentisphaeria bacterium]